MTFWGHHIHIFPTKLYQFMIVLRFFTDDTHTYTHIHVQTPLKRYLLRRAGN